MKRMRPVILLVTLLFLATTVLALDENTVYSFHFDEGKGNDVTDASGNDNHGILGGTDEPEWVEGPQPQLGTALEFSDANFVEIADSPKMDTGEEITFEAWLRLKALNANWSTIYSKHAQSNNEGFHWIYINKVGTLAYQYCNGSKYVPVIADIAWQFGEWVHLAITHQINGKDGGVIQWYVDGQLVHEEAHEDKALLVTGGKASLGTYQSNTALDRYALDGALDEVRLTLAVKQQHEILESMRGLSVEPYRKLAVTWGAVKGLR